MFVFVVGEEGLYGIAYGQIVKNCVKGVMLVPELEDGLDLACGNGR